MPTTVAPRGGPPPPEGPPPSSGPPPAFVPRMPIIPVPRGGGGGGYFGSRGGPTFGSIRALNNLRSSAPGSGMDYANTPGVLAAYMRPDASSVASDPGIAAAMRAFDVNAKPKIENEAALAGLGTSTGLTKNLADAYAEML